MPNATIKYYPVDNGDCTLLTLGDGTTMLVDCNIRETAAGDTDDTKFDVKQDLLASLKRNASDNPLVDVFVLTHGDQDHCRGFSKNFYQGDPTKYTAEDRKAGRILIEELWFSPMVEELSTNDDEDVFEVEALRRVALHRAKAANCNAPGNRVVIIGYDGRGGFAVWCGWVSDGGGRGCGRFAWVGGFALSVELGEGEGVARVVYNGCKEYMLHESRRLRSIYSTIGVNLRLYCCPG